MPSSDHPDSKSQIRSDRGPTEARHRHNRGCIDILLAISLSRIRSFQSQDPDPTLEIL